MASCSTFQSSQVFTLFTTSIESNVVTATGAPQILVTSTPSLVTSCPTSTPCSGNGTSCESVAPVCVTLTTFEQVTQTLLGSAVTSTKLVTNVQSSLSTSFGPASISCAPSTSTTSTIPTTSTTPSFISTIRPSTQQQVSSSTMSAFVPSSTSVAPVVAATSQATTQPVVLATTTQVNSDVYTTIISYETVVVTGINGELSTQTAAVSIPSMLHQGGNKSTASKGAIAGGIVGGILLLLMALGLLWFLKKKGVLSRGGDERFDEDMWRPSPHAPPGAFVDNKGDRREGETTYLGEGGLAMAEKDEASSLATRPSWYGSGAGGEDVRHSRHISNPASEAYGGYNSSSDYGGPEFVGGSRLSHRRSMQSHSSQSHEGYIQNATPASYLPPLSDLVYARADRDSGEVPVVRSTSNASSRSESARTAATSGSSAGYSLRPPILALTPLPPRPAMAISPSQDSDSSDPPSSMFSSTTTSTGQSSLGSSSPVDSDNIKPVSAFASALKRPQLVNRTYSGDSFLQPSQYLGARVVNHDLTPKDEKESLDLSRYS